MKTVGAIVVASMLATACSRGDSELQDEVAKSVGYARNGVVDLSTLSKPGWQRFCVFGPYTDQQAATALLGFEWSLAKHSSIESDDGITLLVLVNASQVLSYTEFSRGKADFSGAGGRCYTKATAKFRTQGSHKPLVPLEPTA